MKVDTVSTYSAIVIGVSAGGIAALNTILPALDKRFGLPVFIVQHIGQESGNYLVEHFKDRCGMKVKEAEDKEQVHGGIIYFAPPGYHLLVELDGTFALSTEGKVNYSRPSIDVLFETAADAYQNQLVAVILTGANADGAAGLAAVKQLGGMIIVQSPETAEVETMPLAAIAATTVDHILPLVDIGPFLFSLNSSKK